MLRALVISLRIWWCLERAQLAFLKPSGRNLEFSGCPQKRKRGWAESQTKRNFCGCFMCKLFCQFYLFRGKPVKCGQCDSRISSLFSLNYMNYIVWLSESDFRFGVFFPHHQPPSFGQLSAGFACIFSPMGDSPFLERRRRNGTDLLMESLFLFKFPSKRIFMSRLPQWWKPQCIFPQIIGLKKLWTVCDQCHVLFPDPSTTIWNQVHCSNHNPKNWSIGYRTRT